MSVGNRIAYLRQDRRISQSRLASIMGVSRQAVSKWEHDLSQPDTMNLIRLAEVLETDVEFLATGKAIATPPSPSDPLVSPKIQTVEVEKIVEVEKPVEVERIVEVQKIVEVVKPVYRDRIVEVEKIVEQVREKPVIRKVIRYKYVRSPLEYAAIGLAALGLGLIIGAIFL